MSIQMLLTRTPIIMRVSGVECRLWIGHDSDGLEYQVFVHRISTSDPAGQAKLDAELIPQRPPDNAAQVEAQLDELLGVPTPQQPPAAGPTDPVTEIHFPDVPRPANQVEQILQPPRQQAFVDFLRARCGMTQAQADAAAAPLDPPESDDVR